MKVKEKSMLVDNDDIFFPDPGRPVPNGATTETGDEDVGVTKFPHLNDVSRMSSYPHGTPISRIFFPQSELDVLRILQAAHAEGKKVGIRGTKHSMGGHSIVSQRGWEIDCKYLRHIKYDKKEPNVVQCGPGCQWSDLIKVLNAHGKSPRTMQSYSNFSVGGTLAVNAHGITTDYCFAESVIEFRLVRMDPKGIAKTVVCRNSPLAKQSAESKLFGLVLGGYGLFGVISEVMLKVENNVQLELDTFQLKVLPPANADEEISPSEFVRIYDNCRDVSGRKNSSSCIGKVAIKLARLNIITLEKASLYVFRRSASTSTISCLPAVPRELSPTSRLLYKWAMPLLKDLRYAREESSGKALDWSQDDGATRNELLFESAATLSRLYNPLVVKDDTFILQEFFCPHDKFSEWIKNAQPIFKDIDKQQKENNQDLILLNATIRYVEEDKITFLRYSQTPGGMFAFVLYYRIKRNMAVEERLGQFHNRLAEVTVDVGGTFYLPYRKCYSQELLKKAYPMIEEFAKEKERMDPECLFTNLWFEEYVLPLCSESYIHKFQTEAVERRYSKTLSSEIHRSLAMFPDGREKPIEHLNEAQFWGWLPRKLNSNVLRRCDSYRRLLQSKTLRDQFRSQFLVNIFNLADPDQVMRVMIRAAYDPSNKNDIDIYKYIHRHFHGSAEEKGVDISLLPQFLRAIQQLSQNKEELTRQTLSIVCKLGKFGKLQSYVCIGDNGKTIKCLAKELEMKGKLWLVHNSISPTDSNEMPSLEAVLERGCLDSVAHKEVKFDYTSELAREKLDIIPSNSIDLVTMNQGLHHIPLENLYDFLFEVKRILHPQGLFIIREHDLKLSTDRGLSSGVPCPMLDLAHSVFNAVTGVTVKDEMEEIRAFRSILEWRTILEKAGFVDTLVYEIEDGDPTWDVMMCFQPAKDHLDDVKALLARKVENEPINHSCDDDEPDVINLIDTLLSQIPSFAVSNATEILQHLAQILPKIQNKLLDAVLIGIPYLLIYGDTNDIFGTESRSVARQVTEAIEPKITVLFKQMIGFVEGSISLLSQSELKFNMKNVIQTPELFLILPYLERKVRMGAEDTNNIEKTMIMLLKKYLPFLLPKENILPEQTNDETDELQLEPVSPNIDVDESCMEITGNEVKDFVETLAKKLHGLLDPQIVLVRSGFTLPQQATIVSKFGGRDLSSACESIASFLDFDSWNELKKHLNAAAETGELPTKKLLFSIAYDENKKAIIHPWRSALQSFFRCPKVRINQQALLGLRLLQLDEIGKLYKEAKKVHTSTPTDNRYNGHIASYLASSNSLMEKLSEEWLDDVVEKTITYDQSANFDLWDVAEIIHAKFGYISLTSRKVDITSNLQQFHASIHAKLPNPGHLVRIPKKVKIGWLPIPEYILVEMRNNGSIHKESVDKIRKGIANLATLGVAGHNQLKIRYRKLNSYSQSSSIAPYETSRLNSAQTALASGHHMKLKTLSGELCNFLESNDIIRADLRPNDGHYTWFKLNEWMQVEILTELSKSLDHTPWFRFPFSEFLKTYFTVFKDQCNIVKEKYGFMTAYASGAFFTDLIPGIVMTFLFGQLQLLAAPLKRALPDGYSGFDQSRFLDEIVLHLPLDRCGYEGDWERFIKEFDKRILEARKLPKNFVILSTPTFKEMGEILERIALSFATSRVFQISNQKEVQVRVSLDTDEASRTSVETNDIDLQRLLSVPGVQRMMDYQFPNTNRGQTSEADPSTHTKTFYCLQVDCLALLDVFRICSLLPNHKVEQVYDFWN